MRNATCVSLTAPVTILGTKGSVTIAAGWTGDLDQVIGETDDHPLTIAEALGEDLLRHFEIETPAPAPVPTPHRSRRAGPVDQE